MKNNSKDLFLWSNEQLDGQEIFRIIRLANEAYTAQDLKQYYVNVRNLASNFRRHISDQKIRKKIKSALDSVQSVVFAPKPTISQHMGEYTKRNIQAFNDIETIYEFLNDEVNKKGFFKKTFSTPTHSLAVNTQWAF